jgi:hypothetical protein
MGVGAAVVRADWLALDSVWVAPTPELLNDSAVCVWMFLNCEFVEMFNESLSEFTKENQT